MIKFTKNMRIKKTKIINQIFTINLNKEIKLSIISLMSEMLKKVLYFQNKKNNKSHFKKITINLKSNKLIKKTNKNLNKNLLIFRNKIKLFSKIIKVLKKKS